MKTRMMVLISILLMVSISCQMMTDFLPSGGANPSSFTAVATSPISVQLTWSSAEGAQKYLIERKDGPTDYFSLGELSGETTTFEDFLVPPNTQITYRIKTVTASGTSGGKTVSLTTPQEVPNPLTVAATFDTQNAQIQAIGPDGGRVSLTDSKGVRYTLDIPAGALDNEVTFTLTPIQEIQSLPLSGGMTSGVRIEPEGLTFNESATLSIETTEAAAADEMINMAFAFDGEGSEFHFVPGSSAAGTSGVFKVARPASVGSWNVINVPQTKSYGNGKGTSKDIRNQVKNHAPTSPTDNLNQRIAAIQDRINAMRWFGGSIENEVKQITDWESFNEQMPLFRQYWNLVDEFKYLQTDEVNSIIDDIWDELTTKTHTLLDKVVEDCKKSPNLADAKKLVNRLIEGTPPGFISPFSKKFAEKFNQKYGADALKQIKEKLDKCSPSYKITATSRWHLTGPHEFDIVAKIENAVMKADEQGNFTGSATVNWTVTTTVVAPLCNSVNFTVSPSQAALTGHMDDSGPLAVNLPYQSATGSVTQVCRTPTGTETTSYGYWMAPDPLSFSVASSGGAFNQSQVLVLTNIGNAGTAPLAGSSDIVVIPEGEAVSFNPNNHETSWDDFSILFGALLAWH